MARPLNWLRIFVLASLLAATPLVAGAADMAKTTPLPQSTDAIATGKQYLEGRAALLLLRARFDDVSIDDIPGLLAADAKAVATTGPSVEALAELDSSILAEGSYYIVSLKYLVQSGGALWPTDKSENTYVNDALAKLRELQVQLFAAVQGHADPLPVFAKIDRVNAWTEGYADLPKGLDHFSERDDLVEAALAATRPVGT